MTAPIKLASLVGKLKISAENSQVQVINVGAFDDPAGLLDTSLVPLDDTATGLRTTQGNTVVVPSRASRNDITIRAVGGPIRYGYTDIPDLHLKGFLIDEGRFHENYFTFSDLCHKSY